MKLFDTLRYWFVTFLLNLVGIKYLMYNIKLADSVDQLRIIINKEEAIHFYNCNLDVSNTNYTECD